MKQKTITISLDDLEAAFTTWGHQHRLGLTMPVAEALKEPVETVATQSAQHLWNLLHHPVVPE